jgi:hypothetical protein
MEIIGWKESEARVRLDEDGRGKMHEGAGRGEANAISEGNV